MLTGIVKATRAHYAALQHKPSADRIPLDYCVSSQDGQHIYTRGTVHVKACGPNHRRERESTRLLKRLAAMYPEAAEIECSYRRTSEIDGQRFTEPNYGATVRTRWDDANE